MVADRACAPVGRNESLAADDPETRGGGQGGRVGAGCVNGRGVGAGVCAHGFRSEIPYITAAQPLLLRVFLEQRKRLLLAFAFDAPRQVSVGEYFTGAV